MPLHRHEEEEEVEEEEEEEEEEVRVYRGYVLASWWSKELGCCPKSANRWYACNSFGKAST
jgi:hypothetical protein